eukprot:COSAG02_NODE_1446_length_12578_cov_3.488661_7_plen_409_part_00
MATAVALLGAVVSSVNAVPVRSSPGEDDERFPLTVRRLQQTALDSCNAADLVPSGRVDTTDLLALLAAYGRLGTDLRADINQDGIVATEDLLYLLAQFGRSCPNLPGSVHCQGSWSVCEADCADKTFTVTTPASGQGAECEYAAGATSACAAGEGNCPPNIDCEGSWSVCEADCADKTFTVTTPASGQGAECEYAAGATSPCAAGEGNCPLNIDCEGSWLPCSLLCESTEQRTWIQSVAQSGTGQACPTAEPCLSDLGTDWIMEIEAERGIVPSYSSSYDLDVALDSLERAAMTQASRVANAWLLPIERDRNLPGADGACFSGALEDALADLETNSDLQASRLANAWLLPIERDRGLSGASCNSLTVTGTLSAGLDAVEELVNYVAARQGVLDAILENADIPSGLPTG